MPGGGFCQCGRKVLLVWFAERGFPQTNRVTLTKSCRCNDSASDDIARNLRLAGVLKLFAGSFESFTHCSNRLRFKHP
jgi:hypothetical protein